MIHGDVGVAQHVLGIRVAALAGGDPHAGCDGNAVPVDIDRLGEAGLHPLDDLRHGARREVVEQQCELVSAESCRKVGRPQATAQPMTHLRQQAVAGEVAERVVDELEAVEIEEDHSKAEARRRPRVVDRKVQALEEQLPIGQTGDLVVQGPLSKSLLQLFAGLAVVDRADHAHGRSGRRTDRKGPTREAPIATIR